MKRTLSLLIAVAALGMSALTFAQEAGPKGGAPRQGGGIRQGGPGGGMGMRMDRAKMQEIQKRVMGQLNLTAAQKAKIAAAQKKMEAGMKAVMDKKGDRDAMRTEMRKVNTEYRDSMKTILTKEQLAKYQKLMRAEFEALRAKNGGKPGAPGAPKKGGKAGG